MTRFRCALILSLLLLSSSTPRAQNLFSRYYRDQERKKVEVGPTTLKGTRRGQNLHLTEQEVIEMALINNLDVNVQRHRYIEDEWTVEEDRAVYDPAASFSLNWDRAATPAASVLAGGDSVTNILTLYNFGYSHRFSTGSSFEISFDGDRSRSTSFFSSLVPAINTSFEVLFRQNLLRGFGRIAADYDIEISRNNLDISEQEFVGRANRVIFDVLDRYWELQFAVQDIAVNEKSLELANAVLAQNQARFEVGTAARLQVVEAEAEVAARRVDLIRSRFAYRSAQDQLVRLITSYPDPRQFPGEIVPATAIYDPPAVSESFAGLRESALELRPEAQQAELRADNERIDLERSRNGLKPTLDLVAGYRQYGLGGIQVIRDFSRGFADAPVVDVTPGGLGKSLDQLTSGDFYGYVLGLNLQFPIGNTEARARNARAQVALERALLEKRGIEQVISLEIRDALTRIESTAAGLEEAEATVRAARERLEGEQARFEVGVGTTRELIEAQRDLLRAESVLLRSRVDLIKSHSLLDLAVGRSFRRHNIRRTDALQVNVK